MTFLICRCDNKRLVLIGSRVSHFVNIDLVIERLLVLLRYQVQSCMRCNIAILFSHAQPYITDGHTHWFYSGVYI